MVWMILIISSVIYSNECEYRQHKVNDSLTVTVATLDSVQYSCFDKDTYVKVLTKLSENSKCDEKKVIYERVIERCDIKDSLLGDAMKECRSIRDDLKSEYDKMNSDAQEQAEGKFTWFGMGFGAGTAVTGILALMIILTTGK
jgi:hypothetical protein